MRLEDWNMIALHASRRKEDFALVLRLEDRNRIAVHGFLNRNTHVSIFRSNISCHSKWGSEIPTIIGAGLRPTDVVLKIPHGYDNGFCIYLNRKDALHASRRLEHDRIACVSKKERLCMRFASQTQEEFKIVSLSKICTMNCFHTLKISITVLLMAVLAASCNKTYVGEGEMVTRTRETEKFNKIALNMDAIVRIKDSTVNSCTITAQENLQDIIITRNDGNTLVITTKGTVETRKPIEITLSLSQASSVEINGSGIIQSVNTIKNDEFDFEVNGSGELQLDIVAVKVTGAVSGSGLVNLSGSTNEFHVEINGSGTVDANKLSTLNSKVRIAGSGEVNLQAEETLEANVTGSGVVNYRGNAVADKNIEGSGKVVKLD